MERLTLQELAAAVGGRIDAAPHRRVPFCGISIDSRTVKPGELFWAIRGPNHDGHRFIADAAKRGAAAVVVEQDATQPEPITGLRLAPQTAEPPSSIPQVIVPSSIAALGQFAAWYRRLQDAIVLAVTGSVGKTSTRELLYYALGGRETAVRSPKNYNNQLGVPLSLCELDRRHRYGVFEIGASRMGEVANLSQIVRPEAGIITRLGVAHIADFGGREQIAQAKGELLDSLPESGFAILPGDQPVARTLVKRTKAPATFVGLSTDSDVQPEAIDPQPEQLRFRLDGSSFTVRANGPHFAVAASMAITAARKLGRSDRDIARSVLEFEAVPGRCRVALREPFTVIDDSYNANPDSMAAALATLAAWPATGRRIFVCGDMWGLGDWTADAHFELGQQAASHKIDQLIAIGDHARQVTHGARREGMDAHCLAAFPTRDAASTWLQSFCQPGDVLIVKASRPLELERLVAELCATATQSRAA